MKKKISLLLSAVIAVSVVLAGCGSNNSGFSAEAKEAFADEVAMPQNYMAESAMMAEDNYYSDDVYEYREEEAPAEVADAGSAEDAQAVAATSNRKLIKTVNMSVETREFDKLLDTVNKKVDSLGGYIENSNISGNSYGSTTRRDAYLVARIPSKNLDSFVTLISEKSNVTNKSENAEDVTLQYADMEARKSSLRIEQERLNALLEQADSLENIIELENRLTEVRYELESYESKLRTMDNQVDYSTVNLNVFEVVEYTPEPIEELTFGQRLSREFLEGCENAFETIQDFIIGFVSFLPELLVILIILAIIFFIGFFIVKGIIALVKKSNAKKGPKVKKGKPVATAVAEPVATPVATKPEDNKESK